MSLTVTQNELEAATLRTLTTEQFDEIVERSIPDAMQIINELVEAKMRGVAVAEFNPPSITDHLREQLLRFGFSTSMRLRVEQKFGVLIACRNCHAVAVFSPDETEAFAQWTSMEAQVINQAPDKVDC